ncbi:MAG: Slp family lipoprotein [Methylococcales bacterium]
MKRYLFTICLFLTACANIPPTIENAPAYDISYSQATQAINNFKGAPVRWGGIIVDVQNEQTFSQLQILFYPLNRYGRPQLDQANAGRFVVKSNDFLDPAIYTKNLEITVAGTLNGDVEQVIGNKTLRLPLLSANTVYLWPVYDPYYGGYDRFGGAGRFGGMGINSFYGYGPYYPYYGGWYNMPIQPPPRHRR